MKKRIISVIYARETDLVKQSLDLLTDPKYKMGIDQGVFVIRAAQSPWPTQTKSPLEANPRFLVIPALENAEGPCIGWDIGLSFAFANLQADYALNLPIDALYLGGDTVKEHLHELVEKADEEDFDLIIGEYDSHPVKDLIEGHVREQLEKLALKNTVNQQVKEQIKLIKRPRSEFFCVKRDFYVKFRKERSVLPFELTVQMLVYMSRRGGRLSSIHMGHYEGRGMYGWQNTFQQVHRASFAVRNEILQLDMRMTTDQVEDALESGELPLTRLVRESVQKERERLVSIAREAIDEKYIL